MSEIPIPRIEKEDIVAPHLEAGQSAIVFQRHEKYNRDRNAEYAGSLLEDEAASAFDRDVGFFEDIFSQDTDETETMVLFMSSDTQYAGKGRRSLETAQLAQDAAIKVLEEHEIDPKDRIINLNSNFKTDGFEETNQAVRPDKKIREPQIFETPKYVDYLRRKYGAEDGPGKGISPRAWAMHEMDAEKEVRKKMGAESVHDMLDRTKKSLMLVERYTKIFHANNPNKKLLVWMASHYDTLSPLVKEATEVGFDEYLPVDYGAGVVIELKGEERPVFTAKQKSVSLNLGANATKYLL
jgi:hypothetical protein